MIKTVISSSPGSPPIATAEGVLKDVFDWWEFGGLSPLRRKLGFRHSLNHAHAAFADTKYILNVRIQPSSLEKHGYSRSVACDSASARFAKRQNGDYFAITSTGSGAELLSQADRHKMKSLLVMPIVHSSVLIEESALDANGRFRDATERTDIPDSQKDRVAVEFELATTILVPTRSVARSLTQNGVDEAKIVIAPYGSTHPVAPAIPPSQRSGAIMVGTLVQRKGIEDIVAAAEITPDVQFKLVGSDPFRVCDRVELPNVQFLGKVSAARVQQLLRSSRTFVLPSRGEGLPLATLEAIAAGCVPLVSSEGGAEFLADTPIPTLGLRSPEQISTLVSAYESDDELFWEHTQSSKSSDIDLSWNLFTDAVRTALLGMDIDG